MTTLTDENFEEFLKKAKKPVLVDVFTAWCPPCKMLSPVMEKVAEEYAEKIIVAKMDLDLCPITGNKYEIDRIPTVILFKNNEMVDAFVGFRPKEDIKAWVDDLI
ncbi:MAG: thioredoxin [Candidatus Pacebacteria bacterium]|nr:thioredoxin [Candidatus Paceibacterota bacterium]